MQAKLNKAKEVVGNVLQKANPLNWFKKDGDALKKKKKKSFKISGITANGYLVGIGDDQREITPKGVKAKEHHARLWAKHSGGTKDRAASGRLKSQQIFEYDGKKYHPDDPLYNIAVAAAVSKRDGDEELASALHFKLVTANKQGGAQGVIDSISTTASYEEPEIEVIPLPAPVVGGGGGAADTQMPQKSKSGESSMFTSAGADSRGEYEIMYKGS